MVSFRWGQVAGAEAPAGFLSEIQACDGVVHVPPVEAIQSGDSDDDGAPCVLAFGVDDECAFGLAATCDPVDLGEVALAHLVHVDRVGAGCDLDVLR
jgi:hypothetical protein